MEVVGVIFALIVLLGIGWVITYLRNQAAKALNRGVFNRGNHRRGQEATQDTIEFTAPVPAAQVIASVKERLNLAEAPPLAFIAALYVAAEEGTTVVLHYGNMASRTFRAVLISRDDPGGGSTTLYTVTNWVLGDGIVRGIPEMEKIAATVRQVGVDLGAGAPSSPPAADVDAALAEAEEISAHGPGIQRYCTACGSAKLGERFCTECGAPIEA